MRDATGQTTIEYAGLLLLVAAVTAGAGSVAGLGAVGDALAAGVRTGICIVAGDVCRASDAVAAGLSPCTVDERARGGGGTLALGIFRVGGEGTWTVASRSDGSVLVTRAEEAHGGLRVGVGLEASPVGIGLGVDGGLDVTIEEGSAWEFPDVEAAGRFLRGDRDAVAPAWRFDGSGTDLAAEAKAELGGVITAGLSQMVGLASGVRVGRGEVTHYLRADREQLASLSFAPRGAIAAGEVLVELTHDAGGPREVAFRAAERVGSRLVQTVARLAVRGEAVSGSLAELARRAVQTGVVERAVYAVDDRSRSLEVAAKLGVALGVRAEAIDVGTRLVGASAWTHGSPARERADCGVTGAPLERTS